MMRLFRPLAGPFFAVFATCSASAEVATLVTMPPEDLGALSAVVGGEVIETGGDAPSITIFYGEEDGGAAADAWDASVLVAGEPSGRFRATITVVPESTYFFQLRAVNASGESWAPSSGSFTTPALALPAVVNRPVSDLTGSSAVLRGEVVETGNDPPHVTVFYGRADGGEDPAAWERSAELGSDSGGFSVFAGGLVPQSQYFYRAFAENAAGGAWAAASESFVTDQQALSPVVINEIHYDEDDKTVRSEFIELYNTTAEAIDLSSWRLSGAIDYHVPAGTTIGPGGFLVVAEKPSTIQSKWGVVAIGPWSGKLNNDGETVRLRDATDAVVDEVDYQLGFPWPTVGAAPSYSIELLNPGLENDLGGSWRASTGGSGDGESTLVAGGSTWRFFPGTEEPSAPGAWRESGFDESAWGGGDGSIGYGQGFVDTELEDMEGNYSTVYFRKAFRVDDPAAIGSLLLQVMSDDGFNAWINGIHVADLNVAGEEVPFDATATRANNNSDFVDYLLPNGGGLLKPGENILAVQLLNSAVDDPDVFFDAILQSNVSSAAGPTPGFPNSAFSTDVPPQIRKVEHSPEQPASDQEVIVSALITDPDGVASATLHYQFVRAGGYIRLTDPAYETSWVPLPMNDSGADGDLFAGDNTWSVTLPSNLQRHRNLVRYRITVEDNQGHSVRVPYADDPQPNFAYFCYDGVPVWRGALGPGSPGVTYSSESLTKVPVYHMIAQEDDILGCMYNDSLGSAKTYRYYATAVYDGVVYDHIKFRIKGQASTRVTGKNKIKWNFNRGHRFQARDNYGRKYPVKWDKFALQTGTCPWWGSNQSTGGMVLNEQGAYKMYRLLGVPSCNTHLFHLRIIDDPREAGATQYDGDFWGLYIALEEPDGRFLDEMGLPDGNLYKMNGSPNKRNQGPSQRSDNSDVTSFISAKNSSASNDLLWWRRTVNMPRYYDYKIGTTVINNTDLRSEWNCLYYFRPGIVGDPNSRRWEMYPWDLDLTWESKPHIRNESVWENWQKMLTFPEAESEFQNRSREVWDLMCNSGEGAKMVEEMKRFLDGDGVTRIVEANQALWDHHPRKAKKGIWYRNNPRLPAARQNWEGLIGYMKDFVSPGGYGADRLLEEKAATSERVPGTPSVTAIGDPAFPTNDLRFRSSAYSGSGDLDAVQWRLAEITDPESPNFNRDEPWVYEITPVWESGELDGAGASEVTIPPVARVGHTYRARVRHRGTSSSQWSHWSDPVEFVASLPDVIFFQQNLVITELMYNPADPSPAELAAGFTAGDFEFVEIKNVGSQPIDLTNVRFTKGIDFDFANGDITSLAPGAHAVVVQNRAAFEMRYGAGLPVAGEFMPDNFSNGGENVKLSFGAGVAIHEFDYLDEEPWPGSADGLGYSLVLADPASVPDHSLPQNWRTSATIGGTPGSGEGTMTFAAWKSSHFSPAELADPLVTGDLVDLDQDGLNTIFEYGLAGEPQSHDRGLLPSILTVVAEADRFPAVRFQRRTDASDLAYTIESSTTLSEWEPASGLVLVERVDNGNGSATETYRLPASVATAPQVFLRLKVSVN